MEYKKVCINCGKEFLIKKYSEFKRENRQCCSRSCATTQINNKRYKNIGIWKQCLYCNKKFFARLARERKTKMFCCCNCALVWRNKNIKPNKEQRKILAEKCRKQFTGVKRSRESVRRSAEGISGAKHWNWQGGKSGWNVLMRSNIDYKEWRKRVFERDNYTCQICGKRGNGDLNADHIKPLSLFPELAYDIKNGRTLCTACHVKTDTFRGRVKMWAYKKGYGGEWGPIKRQECE